MYNFVVYLHVSACKGTKKNVYVQEKFTFVAIGYIFLIVASRIKVPSKVLEKCICARNLYKMHYAVHQHTAAELILEWADADKEHMGLTTWENAPNGKIVKQMLAINLKLRSASFGSTIGDL